MTGPAPSLPSGPVQDMRLVQLVAMIFVVCTGFSSQMVMPLWIGAVIKSLGVSEAAAGSVASFEFAAVAIVSVTVATQVHRLKTRPTALAGLLLLFLGNLLAAHVHDVTLLTLCRVVAGCGKGLVVAITFSLCAGTKHPTRTFAILNASYALFSTAFYLMVPPAIVWNGAAGAFEVMAAVAAAGGIFMIWFPDRKIEESVKEVTPLTKLPVFGLLALATLILFWTAQSAVWTFLERLGEASGLNVSEVGSVLSAGAFLTIGGPALAGFIDTRWGSVAPIFAATCLMIAASLAIVYLPHARVYAVAVPAFLVIALFTVPYLMGILSLADSTGRLAAASSAAMTAGGSLGALAGGLAASHFGYPGLAWTAAGLFVVVLLILLPIASRLKKQAAGKTAPALS